MLRSRINHAFQLASILADGFLFGIFVVTEIATSSCSLCLQHLELTRRRRLWRQAELFIESPAQLLQLLHALDEVLELEVAARIRILVLAVRVLLKVDSLKVVEIKVVYIGIFFLLDIIGTAAFVERLRV